MKTASSDLYYLIKSMSKVEKAFFKKISLKLGKPDKNIYQNLFNIIEKQSTYDEKVILREFNRKSAVKQFSVLKNHLYNRILFSLYIYHSNDSIKSQLRENVSKIEILINIGLHKQAYKLLGKTKCTAYAFEDLTCLSDLLRIEKNLITNVYPSEALEEFDRILNEHLEILRKQMNISVYIWIHSKVLFLIIKYGYIRSNAEDDKFMKLLNHELMKSEELALTTESKALYNGIYSLYYFGKLDFENAYIYTKRLLKNYESNSNIMKERILSYARVSMDLLSLCYHLNKYGEIEKLSNKLEKILRDKKLALPVYMQVFTIGYLLCLKLSICNITCNFSESEGIVKKMQDYMKKHGNTIDKRIKYSILSSISYYHLILGNYSEALKWISIVINEVKDSDYIDAYVESVIIELIIHFELENLETLEYRLESFKRLSSKKHSLFDIERTIFKYFKLLIKNYYSKARCSLFEQFLEELNKNNNLYFQRVAKETIDIFSWIESKIQKRGFSEILKSKNN